MTTKEEETVVKDGTTNHHQSVILDMKSLPISGCWAVPITFRRKIDDGRNHLPLSYTYYAVVDTGSPFLTAPTPAKRYTTMSASNNNKSSPIKKGNLEDTEDISFEQYGTTVGSIEWRMVSLVTLLGYYETPSLSTIQHDDHDDVQDIIVRQNNVVVGLPSQQVQDETGGIFLGLIAKDDHRPSFLQQSSFRSFQLDFIQNTLTLSSSMSILQDHALLPNNNNNVVELFDFHPYGPDLYHYGVLCDQIKVSFIDDDDDKETTQSFNGSELSRPLVAVFDTGLSGCIFSDTLWDEIRQRMSQGQDDNGDNQQYSQPTGCTVSLRTLGSNNGNNDIYNKKKTERRDTLDLSSISEYWRFQAFRLPWWYVDKVDGHNSNPDNLNSETSSLFPHVVVLGSTFWRNRNRIQGLCVDTISRRANLLTNYGI
jgi:hypothetical protein